jgi:hypothetical protein
MQELKPYSKLNLSQTQTFCLHCSGSALWSHRVVPLKYVNPMTLVSIEAWVENAACQLVAVAWLFLVVTWSVIYQNGLAFAQAACLFFTFSDYLPSSVSFLSTFGLLLFSSYLDRYFKPPCLLCKVQCPSFYELQLIYFPKHNYPAPIFAFCIT